MPATEKTWRDQKVLHIVFAFTSVAMLLSTFLMFAVDHNRSWKNYQSRSRDIERRINHWRLDTANSESNKRLQAELTAAINQQRSQPIPQDLLDRFKQQVRSDEARLEEIGRAIPTYDFSDMDARNAELIQASATAAEKRATATAMAEEFRQARDEASQVQTQLEEAKLAGADQTTLDSIEAQIKQFADRDGDLREALEQANAAATSAEQEASEIRTAVLEEMNEILARAKLREDVLASRRKFTGADLDAAKATLGLRVRDGKSVEELAVAQAEIDPIKDRLDDLTKWRDDAITNRETIQSIIRQITASESELEKRLEDSQAEAELLEAAIEDRRVTFFRSKFPFIGKRWLELPILNAFNSPLKIDNLWTEGLTQPIGSFGQIRRFDRCTTCHKGIDKTMPGSAIKPAYRPAVDINFTLFTPDAPPQPITDEDGNEIPVTLETAYGIRLAEYGLVRDTDVSISYIEPGSLAANAVMQVPTGHTVEHGLQVGDVFTFVNGDDKVLDHADLKQFLLQGVTWGEPVTVSVRRGLPQPYTTHPRLDLFVGSLSPHKLADVACTVCHEGSGTATEFKYVSHTPNDPQQAKQWAHEHGWFNNHHWIYPMFPKRFAESACLKCHHDVVSLNPSERFPDPPAPKLMEGYDLVLTYGCFGCHEINGYDGPDKRVGPDIRLEPNFYAAAAQVKADPNFTSLDAEVQDDVRSVIHHPENNVVRNSLRDWLLKDADADQPQLTVASHKMAEVLADIETPGTMRKVGPTLRYIGAKSGEPFLYDWIREPKNFRPTTRMPQFFGHWDHLEGEDLELAKKSEPIEILGMVKYLLAKSQPLEYLPREEGTTSGSREEQIARGKLLFETRGCLACHQHEDFPNAHSKFAPDLTGIADKLSPTSGAPNGRAWLYTWIKQPTHYNPRTKMPDLYLDPITDAEGNVTDPAADIVEYLLSSSKGWQPPADSIAKLSVSSTEGAITPDQVDDFVLANLKNAFVERVAKKYLTEGIQDPEVAASLKGGEIELVGEINLDKKLNYIGRKSIVKYGCHGCHDIPGFEDAKTIGTGLADWGRKETSKLAFEHIIEYLHHGGHGHAAGDHGHREDHDHSDDGGAHHDQEQGHDEAHHDAENDSAEPFDESYYVDQINAHAREGFIWQKLKEPRSYDYKKTTNKRYDERLRMPLFPLTPQQREAVVTFVLGLVAEPPAEKFLYHPTPRREALVQGKAVIEKYNCAGCHILELDKWELEFQPGDFDPPPAVTDYAFLAAHLPDTELAKSATPDPYRGVLRTTVVGTQAVDDDTAQPIIWDEEGDPIEEGEQYDPSTFIFPFELWEPAALEGTTHPVGVRQMAIPATSIRNRTPGWGGDLTRMLMPTVTALEKQVNPAAKGTESMSWLPPPLIGQGTKVQPDWMHDFLLEPYPIRPAVFLRMPRFNMSSEEATKIVNYFAARDDMSYPFDYDPRTSAGHLTTAESQFRETVGSDKTRLEHAMQIVTNGNYCVKCHLIGEYTPSGSTRALAPNLAEVHNRLRPDFVRRWIANPKKILPYTAMPVNIPFNPNAPHLGGVDQAIYPGTSIQQLDALVDLLMNFPTYSSSQNDIGRLVSQQATTAPGAAEQPSTGDEARGEARPSGRSATTESASVR